MHFAYQPRKSSSHTPYPIRSRRPPLQRGRVRALGVIALGILSVIYLFYRFSGSSSTLPRPPAGTPPVVIVTVLDDSLSESHKTLITHNRRTYASQYGYETFFPNSSDYNVGDALPSWAKIPAIRHAMTLYPHSTFFWLLGPFSLITNLDLSLEEHVVDKARLESLMILDIPVVPPDSVIKTFSHLKGDQVDLILTQDKHGISQESFIIRSGEWAKFFLDAWFDPIYRSYNFQKAEAHALEHLVQWHGTILAKLALIPLKTINAYSQQTATVDSEYLYTDGDFVATFLDCTKSADEASCEAQMEPFAKKFQSPNGDA